MSELPKLAGHCCWTSGGSPSSSGSPSCLAVLARCLAARLLGLGGLVAGGDRLVVELLAVLVDGRAVGAVAHVVPHAGAVVVGRRGVDVVAEELGGQVVLRGPAWRRRSRRGAPDRTRPSAPVDRGVRVLDHADECSVVGVAVVVSGTAS